MFENLSNKFSNIFKKFSKNHIITEKVLEEVLKEIRLTLLESDVALPVVKKLIEEIKVDALGVEVIRSLQPEQVLIKIVHDKIVNVLGETVPLNIIPTEKGKASSILLLGLQGSGKTTASGKLAVYIKKNFPQKKILLCSLDVYRPAAKEQLEILAKKAEVASLPIIKEEEPLDIVKRALDYAKKNDLDFIIFDTAGRLHIDENLMEELKSIESVLSKKTSLVEKLLVADAMTGQDAVNIAKSFKEAVDITGIILSRVEGDGRGGACLSMRYITQSPIKFLGTGEKLEDLDLFAAERVADRILGMGDVVQLVNEVSGAFEAEDAENFMSKIASGKFDFNDMKSQLLKVNKIGGLGKIINLLPGMQDIKQMMAQVNSDSMMKKGIAIIDSMSNKERKDPKIINESRRNRIAKGSGTSLKEVNELIDRFKQMQKMFAQAGKSGNKMAFPSQFGKFQPKAEEPKKFKVPGGNRFGSKGLSNLFKK